MVERVLIELLLGFVVVSRSGRVGEDGMNLVEVVGTLRPRVMFNDENRKEAATVKVFILDLAIESVSCY